MLPTINATRYVVPLREGGSLPAVMEADDLGTYIVKFTGAGQGPRVLLAEILGARLARAIGLRTPDLAVIDLTPAIATYEADEEAQDLLTASIGPNLASDFLPGSTGFDDTVTVSDEQAVPLLWFDLYTGNPDRTWRNPNLLMWHGDLWCIDHGAAFYPHHGWGEEVPRSRFAKRLVDPSTHVMSTRLRKARADHDVLAARITDAVIDKAVADLPDIWLDGIGTSPDDARGIYADFLRIRRDQPEEWL